MRDRKYEPRSRSVSPARSFALDYGAAAAKYIDAFFANVQWDEVERRLERARKAAQALRAS